MHEPEQQHDDQQPSSVVDDIVEQIDKHAPPPETPAQRRRAWRELRKPILIRLGIAVVVLGAIAILHPSFLGWAAVVTAAVIAVPVARFKQYTAAFLPYASAWLIFTLLRALADETGVPLRTAEVTGVERWLFRGVTPTIWLQERLYEPGMMHWYDYATTFVHWSYFFVPHVAAILIWRRNPALFNRFLITTILTLTLGLVVYFLSPAAPPWLTADAAPQTDIYRVMVSVGRSISPAMFDRTYGVLGDPNPVAAMPSLHTAITFMLVPFAFHHSKKLGFAALLYSIAMAFSLVYTGEHYVIDTIVGSAIAMYAYLFSGRWIRVTAPFLGRLTQPKLVPVNVLDSSDNHEPAQHQ